MDTSPVCHEQIVRTRQEDTDPCCFEATALRRADHVDEENNLQRWVDELMDAENSASFGESDAFIGS